MARSASIKQFQFFLPLKLLTPADFPAGVMPRMHFGLTTGNPKPVKVRWYFCAPTAVPIPGGTIWANTNYLDDTQRCELGGVGELPFQGGGVWSNGKTPKGARGDHFCGKLEDFQAPKVWSIGRKILARGKNGLPTCCAPGGLVLAGGPLPRAIGNIAFNGGKPRKSHALAFNGGLPRKSHALALTGQQLTAGGVDCPSAPLLELGFDYLIELKPSFLDTRFWHWPVHEEYMYRFRITWTPVIGFSASWSVVVDCFSLQFLGDFAPATGEYVQTFTSLYTGQFQFRGFGGGTDIFAHVQLDLVSMEDYAVTGAIMPFGGTAAPTGWLACDGSAVSRTTYAALFALIGTTWGAGDGSTTFNLPDLRGRAAIGAGTGSGLTARSVGQSGGEENHILTTAELASHQHGVHSVNKTRATGAVVSNFVAVGGDVPDNLGITATEGSGTAHNTMQPWACGLYIIKT